MLSRRDFLNTCTGLSAGLIGFGALNQDSPKVIEHDTSSKSAQSLNRENIAINLAKRSDPNINEIVLTVASMFVEASRIIDSLKKRENIDDDAMRAQCSDYWAAAYTTLFLFPIGYAARIQDYLGADKSLIQKAFNCDADTAESISTMNTVHFQTFLIKYAAGPLISHFRENFIKILEENPDYNNDPRNINPLKQVLPELIMTRDFAKLGLDSGLDMLKSPADLIEIKDAQVKSLSDLAFIASSYYAADKHSYALGRSLANIPRSAFISRDILSKIDDSIEYKNLRGRYQAGLIAFSMSHLVNELAQKALNTMGLKVKTGNKTQDKNINDLVGLLVWSLSTIFVRSEAQAHIGNFFDWAIAKGDQEPLYSRICHQYIKPVART